MRWFLLSLLGLSVIMTGCDLRQPSGQQVYYRADGQVTQVKYHTNQDWRGNSYGSAEVHRYPDKQAYNDANTSPLVKIGFAVGAMVLAYIFRRGGGASGGENINLG
jgi:hypothetical protein